jgi:hypothetical protein
MRHTPHRELAPDERRRRVADIFARHLNELASRGLVVGFEDDGARDGDRRDDTRTADAPAGSPVCERDQRG